MAVPLAVSVVLSILAVFFADQSVLIAYAQKPITNATIDKLEVKRFILAFIYNHKLQTGPWHREKEPHNNQKTPGRQKKAAQPALSSSSR